MTLSDAQYVGYFSEYEFVANLLNTGIQFRAAGERRILYTPEESSEIMHLGILSMAAMKARRVVELRLRSGGSSPAFSEDAALELMRSQIPESMAEASGELPSLQSLKDQSEENPFSELL